MTSPQNGACRHALLHLTISGRACAISQLQHFIHDVCARTRRKKGTNLTQLLMRLDGPLSSLRRDTGCCMPSLALAACTGSMHCHPPPPPPLDTSARFPGIDMYAFPGFDYFAFYTNLDVSWLYSTRVCCENLMPSEMVPFFRELGLFLEGGSTRR